MEISAVSHARGRVFDALERMGGDPTMELWRLIRAAFDALSSWRRGRAPRGLISKTSSQQNAASSFR